MEYTKESSSSSSSSSVSYLKVDNNRIINEKCIVWVKKMNDCLEVCMKTTGCDIQYGGDTHRICKVNSIDSYQKLNKNFE